MKKQTHKIVTIVAFAVFIVVASNIATYSMMSKELNQSVNAVRDDLYGELIFTREYIMDVIEAQREFNVLQREKLENETLNRFHQLQDYIDEETAQLQLNLQGELEDVRGETQVLNERIGNIQAGSDFSSVISNSIETVVSVRTNLGQGSGVIFHPDGYVMTNQHVLQGATQVALIDYDGNFYSASLIAVARVADLAVLKIVSDKQFDYLEWASPSSIEVGNRVVALGNPLGLSFTATEGIISAVNRQIDYTSIGYIQTDVPINPGNSGGPLINANGRIVGINTVKLSGAEGLGFAIPSTVAEDLAQEALAQN